MTTNRNLDDFYQAWTFLVNHPYFQMPMMHTDDSTMLGSKFRPGHIGYDSIFAHGLDIMVAKVNPITDKVDDDESKNTHTEIWLECGPWHINTAQETTLMGTRGCMSHDYELDVGGDTFEEAICALAQKVLEKEGDYDPDWEDHLFKAMNGNFYTRRQWGAACPVHGMKSTGGGEGDMYCQLAGCGWREGMKACEFCRKFFYDDDLEFTEDPYNHDINGDTTKHHICENCLDSRRDDI